MADYIIKATDSKGNNIKDKVEIKIDGVKSDTKILESILEEKTVCIEFSYLDSTTNLITQQLIINFKTPTNPLVGTYSNENYLLYVKIKEGYSVQYDNTISNLINQINSLPLSKYRDVIACSLRVLFELSLKCVIQSSKNLAVKNSLVSDTEQDIKTIIEFCQHNGIKTKIDESTKITFKALGNILEPDDFIKAYRKSNLGPHSSTTHLTDDEIRFIAKKAAYFVVFINELINNPSII